MASDISITITADPNQAVTGIGKVTKAERELGKAAKEANAAASDSTGGISRMADGSGRSISRTITATGELGASLKKAGRDAAGITSALGDSVPVVGKLGSAISAVISGPLGIISAAIAAAGMAIQKIIADAEARVARLKASAEARSSAAYDRLMQGRADYAAQLNTLAQVKELNALAKQTDLTGNEQAALRVLAGQLGIDSRYISARGINPNELSRAQQRIRRDRASAADAEYQGYLDAVTNTMRRAIESSDLNDITKQRLNHMSLFEQADAIRFRAQSGSGYSKEEVDAFQNLYGIVKQLDEVRRSYNADAMQGRTQAQLNAEAVAGVKSGVQGRVESATERKRLEDRLNRDLQDQISAAGRAKEAEVKEQQRRQDAFEKQIHGLEKENAIQELLTQGKAREAYLLRQRMEAEERLGQKLSEAQLASLDALSGRLYDLQHPAEAALEAASESMRGPGRVAARQQTASGLRLDRLQRIGANVTVPVSSPEKVTLDKQLNIQEQMNAKMDALIQNSYKMRF